jgi:hypothetical protein
MQENEDKKQLQSALEDSEAKINDFARIRAALDREESARLSAERETSRVKAVRYIIKYCDKYLNTNNY